MEQCHSAHGGACWHAHLCALVPVRRLDTKGRQPHCDDAGCDVGEVQVEAVPTVAAAVAWGAGDEEGGLPWVGAQQAWSVADAPLPPPPPPCTPRPQFAACQCYVTQCTKERRAISMIRLTQHIRGLPPSRSVAGRAALAPPPHHAAPDTAARTLLDSAAAGADCTRGERHIQWKLCGCKEQTLRAPHADHGQGAVCFHGQSATAAPWLANPRPQPPGTRLRPARTPPAHLET